MITTRSIVGSSHIENRALNFQLPHGQGGKRGVAGDVNYAVKSSFLLSFLVESVPAVSAKLKAPNTQDEKFEDVVKSAQNAAVLVLVY